MNMGYKNALQLWGRLSVGTKSHNEDKIGLQMSMWTPASTYNDIDYQTDLISTKLLDVLKAPIFFEERIEMTVSRLRFYHFPVRMKTEMIIRFDYYYMWVSFPLIMYLNLWLKIHITTHSVFIVYCTHDSMIIWSDNGQEASDTMTRTKTVYLRGLCHLIEDQTFLLTQWIVFNIRKCKYQFIVAS